MDIFKFIRKKINYDCNYHKKGKRKQNQILDRESFIKIKKFDYENKIDRKLLSLLI
jgi:hypothetical protein